MIQVFVPYLGPSLNSIYAGVHWATRKRHADAAHRATQIAARGLEPITRPVHLTLQPVLGKGKRRLDCSNYGYTLKLIEDGLVRSGLLKDDTPDYVVSVQTLAPIRDPKRGSGVWVIIQEVAEGAA